MDRIGTAVSSALAGAAGALLLVLATRDHSPAYAAPQDNAGDGMLVAGTGGTQNNINDLVFVVYRRQDPRIQELFGQDAGDQRITMSVYRIEPGRMSLVLENARDITLDLQLPDYQRRGGQELRVRELRRELRRQLEDRNR